MENTIRNRIALEITELELFHTHVMKGKKEIRTYEIEGFNKEKIEAEGSIWYVYVQDCINEYYQRHKERIDEEVDGFLKQALEERVICK